MGLESGQLVDERYRVNHCISEGGFGAVYNAFDIQAGTYVALKVLHPGLAAQRHIRERFLKGADIGCQMAQAKPGRFPEVYDVVETHLCEQHNDSHGQIAGMIIGKTHAMVMELLQGGDLANYLKYSPNRRLGCVETVDIGVQICDALEEVHAGGFVMRDLKPENIMRQPDGTIKLFDFDLAVPFTVDESKEPYICGTHEFLAPERWGNQTSDHRADLYAVGITLYRLLDGCPPFRGPRTHDFRIQHRDQTPKPLTGLVPEELWLIIKKLLEKDPANRFQSARETGLALSRFAVDQDYRLKTKHPYCDFLGTPDVATLTEAMMKAIKGVII